jgi:hypothetical protein
MEQKNQNMNAFYLLAFQTHSTKKIQYFVTRKLKIHKTNKPLKKT